MTEKSPALLPGRRGIAEVLRHRPERVRGLLIREGAKFDPEFRKVLAEAEKRGLRSRTLQREQFDTLLQGVNAQGIAAEIEEQLVDVASLSQEALAGRGCILVCDQIADPRNLGAILRVAAAVGVDGVLLTKDRSVGLTPAVRKAAVGASELLPIAAAGNLQRALQQLKSDGFWLVGAALGEQSVDLFEAQTLHPVAIILGSEGTGIRKLTKKLCDVLVEIPMDGQIGSLNVSQAAAVILYEWYRRRAAES